jgi:hypothetical protein
MIMGEMGRSLFRHPGSYMKLISKYRGTLARGKVRLETHYMLRLRHRMQCDISYCWLVACAAAPAAWIVAEYVILSGYAARWIIIQNRM